MVRRHKQRLHLPLRIMQANVGRSPSAHDLALVHACNNQIDILLIQEPWIFTDLALRKSKTHPSFEAFSPLSTWNSRPRVFTYVRRGKELRPFQPTTDLSRDLLQISVSLHHNKLVSIWNIYNAPIGSEQEGEGLTTLLRCRDRPYFIAGDFNLRHLLWDLTNSTPRPACQELIDWYGSHNLHLLNPTETPTHNRGGTIDLAFCIDNNAKCEVRTDLHTISDHETLVTTIHRESQTGGLGKLRYKDIDKELFLHLLGRPTGPGLIRSQDELENEAKEIVE